MTDRIAIVSFAGRFPGSNADLARYWTNISQAVDCSREVPRNRWALPPERCTDPRIANADTVYSTRGYYLDPFEPELTDLDIDRALVREFDPLFQLVLDVGNRAWRGARTENVNRARVGVVLGNICLPTDRANDLCREILGAKLGLQQQARTHPLNRYVAGLPAGLLAKSLKFGGGSFTLDAACASSLYAIKLACDELLAGRADAMLAGGSSRPDCQYTQMGFAQLRALAPSGTCSPFDTNADGLVVGEGAGIFVLKRLTDALAHGDTIHGIIAGVGLSNDRYGNLLAPAKEGQLRAMRTAYERARWKPQHVELIECHATGTPVGDVVEFESLRELWGEDGWMPGQCVIGSVKSTVGHLLTGAGAAALAKVLLALKAETLPPQANFTEPASGLRYANGPFRILHESRPWNTRAAGEPRRAAVSGFGFGGVNAHLLVEEWIEPASIAVAVPSPPRVEPIAVVGIGAHIGPWTDSRALQEFILSGYEAARAPKRNGWALANRPCPPGFYIEELKLPINRFRIPPKELEETLPQQLLMLQVAAAALDDAGSSGRASAANDSTEALTTGVFIGLGLDLNTTNYHLRWSAIASQANADAASPSLTANRTMGALGSIAASRIARTFHFGGPSHTVCSEEGSSARAIELGVRALQAHEIDKALVGGVDLAGDPRMVLASDPNPVAEGAVALVLKRLDDAERDGDRVYAVIRGVGTAADEAEAIQRAANDGAVQLDTAIELNAAADIGNAGATSGGASLAKACFALYQELLPDKAPQFWLHNREAGPRRTAVRSAGSDGTCYAFILEDHTTKTAAELEQPLGARSESLFAAEGESVGDLLATLEQLRSFSVQQGGRNIEALAREWFQKTPPVGGRKHAAAFVARSVEELLEQLAFTVEGVSANPQLPLSASARASLRDRVFYTPQPIGPEGKIAFVFPGSGNQFDAMGRELSIQWPEVLRNQQRENNRLRDQYAPHIFWANRTADASSADLMFGQVAVGSLVSDLVSSLGVRCDAMIGLSLGESAGLFGLRVWRDRDEMYRRLETSTLFRSDLSAPFHSARRYWELPPGEDADWVSGIVAASAEEVQAVLRPGLRAYLLIINTPGECVIGGQRNDVVKLADSLGKPLHMLEGVTLAHCEAGRPVEQPYRELHTLPVTRPANTTIYSGAWGQSYKPDDRACADSITAGLLGVIDVPRVIESAYRDGVRAFIEVGPGNSCSRMIGTILRERPHFTRAAHAAKPDALSQVLRLAANLFAERIPVDLATLYGRATRCVGHRAPLTIQRNVVIVPVGNKAVDQVKAPAASKTSLPPMPALQRTSNGAHTNTAPLAAFAPAVSNQLTSAANVHVLNMQAQESFLRISSKLMESCAGVVRFQTGLLETWLRASSSGVGDSERSQLPANTIDDAKPAMARSITQQGAEVPRALTYEQCCAFAAGKVADALGPLFAEVDTFPTRVRLPDGPLQLVDRITLIEGEPKSMAGGRVVTEHTVRGDRWYLESGRIPTALSVESGQADLFLAGFLGIDFQTRGLAVYRLLDAVVSFHRELPRIGETIVYDIHIDRFVKQGNSWLFHFWFDGKVNGEPFITMRNGVAGFFSTDALAAGKGIVHTALDKKQMPGKIPEERIEFVPLAKCALNTAQVESLRAGDLAAAFGPDFARAKLIRPATLPGGMLRLVDRVPLIDPDGGRFGTGFVRAEFDIHPNDWFLTCHFVDDMVMPGTLMYECCLHTLRIFLMRIGWIGEAGEVVCEPVPGVNSRLKCRGQVTASTQTVTYEVTVKELGYRPEPYCIADALMYADGKPIVEITNMSLRMNGLHRERLEATWSSSISGLIANEKRYEQNIAPVLYDSRKVLAFSNGNPSEAFGEPYRVFDSQRTIARLPGPPFQFLDGITAVTGAPFVMKAGAACEALYTVPRDAWYFDANRSENMPFAVLLEIALQPCGWLAAYCGSALTSSEDLRFRNLGGKATQLRPVTPASGTLTTRVKLTGVSSSAGMIIQHYEMLVRDREGDVYKGTTYFGFFTKDALANQVGIRDASVCWPNDVELSLARSESLPRESPFPAPMLRMVDRVAAYLPNGGSKGLGLVVGTIDVDPAFWFFQAHFYQDPVWPGSLGVESFLQLVKYAAYARWGRPSRPWQTVALGRPHSWVYRGQVLPTDREVKVLVDIAELDDENQRLAANGFLTVDGRIIYQMTGFSLE